MDWLLYDRGLRHERVKIQSTKKQNIQSNHLSTEYLQKLEALAKNQLIKSL